MRVSEVYASTQGEGFNVGRTTVFTRFGGCNLRCPGWPCDTDHAINPAFRDEWAREAPGALRDRVVQVAMLTGATHVTLTGGEPFLQPDGELEELVRGLAGSGYLIDCFSNGTRPYPDWAIRDIQFIMDWKLDGSGETFFGPYNMCRIDNLNRFHASPHRQGVKFVIKDWHDYNQAQLLYDQYIRDERQNIEVFYGRVWDGELTNAQLVEAVMKDKLPWLLNVQMHNYIWPPDERGR